MECPAPGCRRLYRHPQLVTRTCILALLLCGCVGTLAAQQLDLRLSSARVEIGTQFQVTLQSDSPTRIEIEQPIYPSGLELLGGPFPGGDDAVLDGSYSFLLRATQSGRLILPSFRATIRGRRLETEPRLIEVYERGQPNRVPFDVTWSLPSEQLYVGQTIAVSLDVTNTIELFFPDNIALSPPIGALFVEVQGLGDVALQVIDGVELVRFPVATFLVTATAAGVLNLPAATVQGAGFNRRAAPLQIEVLDLPAELEQTVAVGTFDFQTLIDVEELLDGQSAFVTLRIEGRGNMAFLQFPVVEGDGLLITRLDEESAISPKVDGYEGYRTQTLRLTPTQTGIVSARIAPFYWYDVATDTIGIIPAQTLSLRVHPVVGTDPGRAAVIPPILDLQQVRDAYPPLLYRRLFFYLLFAPPLIALLIIPIVRKRRALLALIFIGLPLATTLTAAALPDTFPEAEFEAALTAYNSGAFGRAAEHFASVARAVPDNPGVLYNHGVTRFLATEEAYGLFLVREALRIRPHFVQARLTLEWMEERLAVHSQPPPRLGADIFLVALLVAVYAISALILLLPLPGPRGTFFILLVFGVILLLTSAGGLWAALARRATETIVVGPQAATLLRIPDPEAQPWLELPAGTAVTGIIRYANFYHIRTARRIEGWVAAEAVIRSEAAR